MLALPLTGDVRGFVLFRFLFLLATRSRICQMRARRRESNSLTTVLVTVGWETRKGSSTAVDEARREGGYTMAYYLRGQELQHANRRDRSLP